MRYAYTLTEDGWVGVQVKTGRYLGRHVRRLTQREAVRLAGRKVIESAEMAAACRYFLPQAVPQVTRELAKARP